MIEGQPREIASRNSRRSCLESLSVSGFWGPACWAPGFRLGASLTFYNFGIRQLRIGAGHPALHDAKE